MQVAQGIRPDIGGVPGEVALAYWVFPLVLVLGLLVLLRVTDDGVFATIVIFVVGLVWAHCLYSNRNARPRDKEESDRRANGSA